MKYKKLLDKISILIQNSYLTVDTLVWKIGHRHQVKNQVDIVK